MNTHTITVTAVTEWGRTLHGWTCACGRHSTRAWQHPDHAQTAGDRHTNTMRRLQKGRP